MMLHPARMEAYSDPSLEQNSHHNYETEIPSITESIISGPVVEKVVPA